MVKILRFSYNNFIIFPYNDFMVEILLFYESNNLSCNFMVKIPLYSYNNFMVKLLLFL